MGLRYLITNQEQGSIQGGCLQELGQQHEQNTSEMGLMDLITNQEQVASREAACRSWANSTNRTLLKWV
jgi:hypothetical protein